MNLIQSENAVISSDEVYLTTPSIAVINNFKENLKDEINFSNKSNKSSIRYNNVLTNIDIEYVLQGNDLKENIVVNSPCDAYNFTFGLQLNGLSAKMDAKGNVVILDSKSQETYSDTTLRNLLDSSNPVIILRGWYNETGRDEGHYVVIYDYYWNSEENMYKYKIFDPWDVNEGDSYERSYQNICNGAINLSNTDEEDTGIWDGIVVFMNGDYLNTISNPYA